MEEDVEIFVENEKQSAQQDTSALSDEMRPENGMQFKSREEARQYIPEHVRILLHLVSRLMFHQFTALQARKEIMKLQGEQSNAISTGTTQKLKMRKWKVRGRPQYLSELIAK